MIRRKKGICIECGEERWLYARGLCEFHYKLSNYQKRMKRQQERSNTSFGYNNEKDMFSSIWKERSHVSFLSGRKLSVKKNCSFWFSQMSHVLNKKDYPQYRLNSDNIVLLLIEEHILFDHGTIEQRIIYEEKHNCSWNILFDLQEKLKAEYKEKFG